MHGKSICRTTLRLIALVVPVWLAAATLCMGDVIHFKDGRTLEGKILSETADAVEIKTKFGTVKIERSRIEKIERKESPNEAFEKKLAKLDRKDPEAVFELAMWCKENGLKKEYLEYLDLTLKLSDQHPGANQEVGNVQYEGRWYSAKSLEEAKEAKAERMKARGWVLHDGEWMPELEAKKLQGYQEWEGEWIPMIDYYHRQGERDIPKTFGYEMTISDSDHFTIRSKHDEAYHLELLDYCELEYEHFLRTFLPDHTEHKMLSYFPIPVYILPDIDDCVTFVESDYIKRYNPPKEDVEKRKVETNFSIYFPRPLVVLSEGAHLVGAEDRTTSQIGFMAHHVGHILIRRFKRGGKVPAWVETGVAHYYEGMTNFHQTVSICEYRGFEDVEKWVQGWGNFMEWKKKLVNPEFHNKLPTVRELFSLEIETMNSNQMAKAWSLVTYLLKHHKEAFVQFSRRSFAPYRGDKSLSQEAAWKLAFDEISPDQVEEEWRKWIVKQPIAPSREDRLKLD